ncbi:MAG: dienelactone hydrolase family protein, partial [Ruminiclostridium sp.]
MSKLTNSDSLIIVLHEIYGINLHIKTVIENFSTAGFDVICPNLLGLSEPFDYEQQETAYQHFIVNIGFEKAAQQVKKLIEAFSGQYNHIFLLGYSVGATIAWLCSDENNMCAGVIGYYGSRIRDYMEVSPKCPVLLVFPTQEKSFNVKDFVGSFNKTNVSVHILDGEHGFVDPFCQSYCESSFQKANVLVYKFL